MSISIDIKKQLIKIKELVSREEFVEKEVREIINNYRRHVLDTLELDDRKMMDSLIRPLDLNTELIKRNLALILCDQLLEIL